MQWKTTLPVIQCCNESTINTTDTIVYYDIFVVCLMLNFKWAIFCKGIQ